MGFGDILKSVGGAIPVVGSVVSAAISYLQSKGTNDAEKQARELYNSYLTGRTDVANKIIADMTAHGFDPYGPQVTTTTGSGQSQSSTRSHQDTTTDSRPIITEQYQPMEAQLRGLIEGRLGKGQYSNEEFVRQQLANRVRATTQATAGAEQGILNRLARQGGGALKLAGGLAPLAVSRAGRIADITGNVGTEAREIEDRTIEQGKALTEAFGKGNLSHTVGDMYSNTSGSNTGGSTTTAPPNMGALFSMFAPVAPQAGSNTGFSPGLQAGGDLLSQLMLLYGNRNGTAGQGGYGAAGAPPAGTGGQYG